MRSKVPHRAGLSREMAGALIIAAAVVAGTLADTTPFRQLVAWRSAIKQESDDVGEHGVRRGRGRGTSAIRSDSVPGTGLARGSGRGLGRKRLSDVCQEYGLDFAAAQACLKRAGVVASGGDGMRVVASRLGRTPHQVLELLSAP